MLEVRNKLHEMERKKLTNTLKVLPIHQSTEYYNYKYVIKALHINKSILNKA